MKRAARNLVLALTLPILVWLGLSFVPGCTAVILDGPLRMRFNHRPPEAAFRFAFGRGVPRGVTDLTATGEAWLAGTNVWLRFRAPDAVADSLVAGYEVGATTAEDHLSSWGSTLARYSGSERRAWEALGHARHPQCLEKPQNGNGSGGRTTVWIDRETHQVYVFVFGT